MPAALARRWEASRRIALALLLVVLAGAAAPADARPSEWEEQRVDDPAPAPVAIAAPGPRADVGKMSHLYQSWNNCGPASVVMLLEALGVRADQEEARLALRGPDIRSGMGPQPVDPWVQGRFGVRAFWRNNGSAELLKRFIANGFPVMVTQWLEDPPSRIAHWRVVRGYDDPRGVFLSHDPIRGANVALDYAWFDANWRPFSFRYLALYRPEDATKLRAIVGEDWDVVRSRERLYVRAREEAMRERTGAAWLSLGEAAYQYGLFGEAVGAFERGLALSDPTGVFTLRSSYPNVLRLVGREEEAERARAKLSSSAIVSARPFSVDAIALELAERRARLFAQPGASPE